MSKPLPNNFKLVLAILSPINKTFSYVLRLKIPQCIDIIWVRGFLFFFLFFFWEKTRFNHHLLATQIFVNPILRIRETTQTYRCATVSIYSCQVTPIHLKLSPSTVTDATSLIMILDLFQNVEISFINNFTSVLIFYFNCCLVPE